MGAAPAIQSGDAGASVAPSAQRQTAAAGTGPSRTMRGLSALPLVLPAGTKPLSQEEAAQLAPDLEAAFLRFFMEADDGLALINRKHIKPEIWSTAGEDEAKFLAKFFIHRGQKSAAAAHIARQAALTWEYVAAFMIVGPRAWASVRFLAGQGVGF